MAAGGQSMCPFARAMAGGSGKMPNPHAPLRVPLGTLLALCGMCALAGGLAALAVSEVAAGARGAAQPPGSCAAPPSLLAPSEERPADPDAFARAFLAASGLAAARPPLPPGAGGEAGYRVVPSQLLSWRPRVVLLPGFLDAARCDAIVAASASRMHKSGVAYRPGEAVDPDQEARTSTGVFMASGEDPSGALSYLEAKIAAVTMLPVSHGEEFNVLRYTAGQHYEAHMDTFDPKEYGEQPSQRLATVITYLSDVEEGGETTFKLEGAPDAAGAGADADAAVRDWRGCEGDRFKVKPRKGDAVLFYSLAPDLSIDARALHGACPVAKGEKWVAVKWVHYREFPPQAAAGGGPSVGGAT
ncbi:hypothetical protein Rsub_01014 [Raphidocelis subcapitata]|uniref:Fe2OG dioxygenase domain-containing protein n=1 Tax=Raphidocelis subcapitata TaxID=307507 RepID=A0A2V0NP53_9CHLO|nr:hypothetical protein Rsub_01014 [Raphidocelis subcapitata]|eukprot:GBF88302.1 hypothetical protein Rsub_01014 [Raphidocelis subcapitata]